MRLTPFLLIIFLGLVGGCNSVKPGNCYTATTKVEGEGQIVMLIEVDDIINGVVRYRMYAQANGADVNIPGGISLREMGLEKFQSKVKDMESDSDCKFNK